MLPQTSALQQLPLCQGLGSVAPAVLLGLLWRSLPFVAALANQVTCFCMSCRQVGIRSLQPVGVFLPGDQNYPGGTPFDPLGFSQNPDGFVDQAVREIKNGRLAMLAMLGYFVQAGVTRKGPLENLLDFVADPVHANVFGYLSGSAPQ